MHRFAQALTAAAVLLGAGLLAVGAFVGGRMLVH